MKRILLSPGLLTAIVFLSFTPMTKDSETTAVVPFNEQSSFSLESDSWSDCSGEWIHITGNIHIDVHGVMNGSRINYVQQINYQGLSGEGQTSGKHYSGSGVFNSVYNGRFDGSVYTTISSSVIKMNTPGSGNNAVLTSTGKITVNARGEVIISKFEDSMLCQ